MQIIKAMTIGVALVISANASAMDIFEGTILSKSWEPGKSGYNRGCCGNSYIKQHNAYGPGQHMDQYGSNVTIQPVHGNTGSNAFNRIQRHNAYGPGLHMDQYGRPVRVR